MSQRLKALAQPLVRFQGIETVQVDSIRDQDIPWRLSLEIWCCPEHVAEAGNKECQE